ncbi:MAG TPA: DUF2779 domain-containing protein [Nitrospiraceae bacterium]|nr:DUF2779 domain-containing protein [Nitrospiraceae bacterium]
MSKSRFLSGLQCHKRLYLEIYSPELATEPDEATRAILDRGQELGILARRRFLGGVLIAADHRHMGEALSRTAKWLGDPAVPAIFEAAVQFEDVLIRADVLERLAGDPSGPAAWRLIEVKSSSRVKDVHVDDLAIQAFVLRGAGIRLLETCLMHVNTRYLYEGGEIDLAQLFLVQDLTEQVESRLGAVPDRLAEMRAMLRSSVAPAIEPDGHCHTPYECPFWRHCTQSKPARWIFYLPGGERTVHTLARKRIETIDDIPEEFTLSSLQRRVKDNVEWVSPALKTALETVRYPVHHLDFETFMPAVPKYPRTRPYQAIPVQWSDHIETEDGHVLHHEFLSLEPNDPREELAVTLLDSLGREGSICVYSGYERAVLEQLAEAVPALRPDIERVIARLWDLLDVIKNHYYHPGFQGSFSIKTVLPAVVPAFGYEDLEVRDGQMAAQAYERMVFVETDWVEKMRLRDALLRYCARDTLAMLELRKALRRKEPTGEP